MPVGLRRVASLNHNSRGQSDPLTSNAACGFSATTLSCLLRFEHALKAVSTKLRQCKVCNGKGHPMLSALS
jgi:hypothetical protein